MLSAFQIHFNHTFLFIVTSLHSIASESMDLKIENSIHKKTRWRIFIFRDISRRSNIYKKENHIYLSENYNRLLVTMGSLLRFCLLWRSHCVQSRIWLVRLCRKAESKKLVILTKFIFFLQKPQKYAFIWIEKNKITHIYV